MGIDPGREGVHDRDKLADKAPFYPLPDFDVFVELVPYSVIHAALIALPKCTRICLQLLEKTQGRIEIGELTVCGKLEVGGIDRVREEPRTIPAGWLEIGFQSFH